MWEEWLLYRQHIACRLTPLPPAPCSLVLYALIVHFSLTAQDAITVHILNVRRATGVSTTFWGAMVKWTAWFVMMKDVIVTGMSPMKRIVPVCCSIPLPFSPNLYIPPLPCFPLPPPVPLHLCPGSIPGLVWWWSQGCHGHGKVMEFLEFWNFLEFLEKSWNFA